MKILLSLLCLPLSSFASSAVPQASGSGVIYKGLYQYGVETFIGIRFALTTAGENRFKPPIPYTPKAGTTITATDYGPQCPQSPATLAYSYATGTSEDCLRLNVWRPNGTVASDKLPVLVWIYGGSFSSGNKDEETNQPNGMILQSVANGHPIIHVELNYRLGVFGFAQSDALKEEGSLNAGLLDQRLAFEWVQENIATFGGDPEKVTIHGQSSGGTAVGLQMMAYGATKPFPFQQAICESQCLDLRITGNVTREVMANTWAHTPCNTTTLDSTATLKCLRKLPLHDLLRAQHIASSSSASANIGDQWLPMVDEGSILPAAPSQLIYEHKFAKVNAMIGWCDHDAVLFTPDTINTPEETRRFIGNYLPGLSTAHLDHLLSMYPSSEFYSTHFPNGTVILDSEVYRCGRILRDAVFTCQPILYGQHIAQTGGDVYFYDQNQTVETKYWELYLGLYGLGVAHTSELPYVFGNITLFDPQPSQSDLRLETEETRSWSSFTAVGRPSLENHKTLQGWQPAEFGNENYGTYVIGGPYEGYSGSTGGNAASQKIMAAERLSERCGFFNSPKIVKELLY